MDSEQNKKNLTNQDSPSFLYTFQVKEGKELFVISGNIGHFRKKDLDISLNGDFLILNGCSESIKQKERNGHRIVSTNPINFSRKFHIPRWADVNTIDTELNKEKLKISISRKRKED